VEAQLAAKPSRPDDGAVWAVTGLVALLSIQPVLNLLSPEQMMNTSLTRSIWSIPTARSARWGANGFD
jgi:hypothetical protein